MEESLGGGEGQKDGRLEGSREVVALCYLLWGSAVDLLCFRLVGLIFLGRQKEEESGSRARKEAESLPRMRAGGRQVPRTGDRRHQYKEP